MQFKSHLISYHCAVDSFQLHTAVTLLFVYLSNLLFYFFFLSNECSLLIHRIHVNFVVDIVYCHAHLVTVRKNPFIEIILPPNSLHWNAWIVTKLDLSGAQCVVHNSRLTPSNKPIVHHTIFIFSFSFRNEKHLVVTI